MGLILALAAANGVTRLGSRFAILGAGQRVEADLRDQLYAALQTFPPELFARHSTGDLMTRASSDVSAVRSLVGFGVVSLFSTTLAFGGALAAMLAVDPWLTACAMAAMPVLVLLAGRFNVSLNERTQAMQEQLGTLSGRVQETLAGMAAVRAYTMERIEEIVTAARPAPAEAAPLAAPPSLAFENLTWGYPGRSAALSGVTFSVAPGAMVAVVGPTGAGKTTLGLLLARLWEPPPGTVFVGGRDVTTLPLATLRATVGWVPQEAFLFSRSIEDNVTLGRAGLDVAAAAREAAVDAEVAAFSGGYATIVGERGLTVSGGQRQRLALARALAGRPRILVLDDVFASVDTVTEDAIVRALRASGLTILVATHRLRVAQAADRIVVLDGGRLVASGDHRSLLAAGGLYARLWRRQQLEEQIARA